MYNYNVGDYFINKQNQLCRINDIVVDFSGKIVAAVEIFDSKEFPYYYVDFLNEYISEYLGGVRLWH
jgi:hypothetical protein